MQAREQGLAGATAIRGLMDFSAKSRVIQTFKIQRISLDLPIVVEIVDKCEKLEVFLVLIDDKIQAGLATLEKAQIHLVRGGMAETKNIR